MNLCKRCSLPDGLVLREDGLALPKLKIELDNRGICNLCNDYEKDPYNPEAVHHQFLDILAQTKGTKPFDAIVGFSGGKDGCFVAYDLIRKYDLKVLLISNQEYHPQEVIAKCDEFAEKLQKKYPNNVTYLPYRREDAAPFSQLMHKKSFLIGGLPCSWCSIWGLLSSVTFPYLNLCAPLFVNGGEPKQIYRTRYANSTNPWMTLVNRPNFESFEAFQKELLDKLSKEIALFFNNDKEEMERVLSLNFAVKASDPELPYYQNSIKTLNYFIEKGVKDQSKKEYLLKAVREITFESRLHYFITYFYYHDYDENMIRETLKNDLNYIAPSTHADCCMHGVIDYIFEQKHMLPVSTTIAEAAALARLGKISKEEVESLIMNQNKKVAYPSETDMKNFCEFLDITEKDFNTTIEDFKETFRKYLP